MPAPTRHVPGPVVRAAGLAAALVAAAPAQHDAPLPLPEATIGQLHAAMLGGQLTAEGLAARYQERIAAYDRVGPDLRSVLAVNPDLLAEARQRDRDARRTGVRGPLFGIPVLLKDNIDALPMATTAGSVALAGSVPADDSFLAQRLRAAGAVVLGKATLTEFANFMTTGMPNGYSSLGGAGANPYDPRRGGTGLAVFDTGGSSSGSAIAVSANLACVAIGSETSGSILSPSSQNGVVGIKPTVGLVSRDGILPITADQDTAGPIARSVRDAAIVLGVIAGFDPNDPATAACQTPGNCFSDYTQFLDATALQGARIAVPVPPFQPSAEQRQVLDAAKATLRAAGALLVDPYAVAAPNYGSICVSHPPPAGQSTVLIFGLKRDLGAYLAGLPPAAPRHTLAEIIAFNNQNAATALRFGQSILVAADRYDPTPGSPDHQRYLADRQQDVTVARGILDGVYAGPDRVRGTADDFDALLYPANFGADMPARAGYPSVVVTGGLRTSGIPFGITFTGPAFSEPRLLALAYAFEQATDHRRAPASTPALPNDTIPLNFASARTLGFGCPGTQGVPTIVTVGPPILASSAFALRLGALRANAPALFAMSPASAPSAYGPCIVYPAQPFLLGAVGMSDGSGNATFDLPIPWQPVLSGTRIVVQGGAVDQGANAANLATTQPLEITIGG